MARSDLAMSDNAPVVEVNPAEVTSLHVPTIDASNKLERLLAGANAAATAEAADRLGALIPDHDFGAIAQNVDAGVLAAHTGATVHSHIDPTALLERLLDQPDLGRDRVKVVKSTVRASTDSYLDRGSAPRNYLRARRGGLTSLLADGHSMVFDGIGLRDPVVSALALLFERVFGARVNVNLYVGYAPADAFGFHWDNHEVVILPILGEKNWEIGRNEDLSMHRDFHAASTQDTPPIWAQMVEPGWSIHIPRGWPHRVRAANTLTAHLTVSITRLEMGGILRTAHNLIVRNPVTERAPSFLELAGGPGQSPERGVARRQLGDMFESALDQSVATERATLACRRVGSFRAQLATPLDELAVRNPFGGGWAIAPAPAENEIIVAAGSRAWRCNAEAVELLAQVTGIEAVPYARWASAAGAGCTAEALCRTGMLDLVNRMWRSPLSS